MTDGFPPRAQTRMRCSLWLDNRHLGDTTLGAPDDRGFRKGVLEPSEEYAAARPALLRLTHGLAGLDAPSPNAIHAFLVEEHRALAERGFELRSSEGAAIATELLMIGDYMPADIDVRAFSAEVPIPVFARLTADQASV